MLDGTVLTGRNIEAADGVRHGFFTRQGGVSKGVYASLNCGFGSDDDRAAVRENRRLVASHLEAAHGGVSTVHQVHSADVVTIDAPIADGQAPKADAIVTRTRGLAIGALTADCTPVLFAEPQARIVAAAHAGWRGAIAGVLEATVAAIESLGGDRSQVHVAIGPTIQQFNYEVGPEFEEQFVARNPDYRRFFRRSAPEARPHFDLPGFCRDRLAGLRLASIEDLARCTYADDSLFFSYRRKNHASEADYGRQISAIVLT
ncbi:MAG: peptidoglycan editing factor PgeF [Hyphomicrobiaceae bacterium]